MSSQEMSSHTHEIVMTELHRGQHYTNKLRLLLLQSSIPGDLWSGNAVNLIDDILHRIDIVRAILEPECMDSKTITSSCSEGRVGTRRIPNSKNSPSPKALRTNQPYYDGHEWRKYGQKTISGCPKFPKEYYRCAYREQGCLATKQVQQQSDGDVPVYMVNHNHEHTCKPNCVPELVFSSPCYIRNVITFSRDEPKMESSVTSIEPLTKSLKREAQSSASCEPEVVMNAGQLLDEQQSAPGYEMVGAAPLSPFGDFDQFNQEMSDESLLFWMDCFEKGEV